MKASLVNGRFYIDGREVLTVVYTDGGSDRFPTNSSETLIIGQSGGDNTAASVGQGNTTISGKNIVTPGSNIKVGGDFRIGDG